MVCLYCQAATQVVNSRHQKQANNVWRRRRCVSCGAVFTTHESPNYSASIALHMPDGSLQAFKKEKLFLTILRSCQHRESALDDALALTETALKDILSVAVDGKISAAALVKTIYNILQKFDYASSVQYAAYHSYYKFDV